MIIYLKSRTTDEIIEVHIDNTRFRTLVSLVVEDISAPYYDVFTKVNDKLIPYRLGFFSFLKLFIFSGRYQHKLKNGQIIRTFTTRNRQLSYLHLSDNGMDKKMRKIQTKAYFCGEFVNLIQPFNRPQLAFEKLSERAQESGFAYFKYVQEHYPKEKLYFIIKRTHQITPNSKQCNVS